MSRTPLNEPSAPSAEQRLVESVLEFANMPAGFDADDVYQLADAWGLNENGELRVEQRMTREDSVRQFPKDQHRLQRRLLRLLVPKSQRAALPYAVPPSIARWTMEKLRLGVRARIEPRYVGARLYADTVPYARGVGAWIAWAFLLLLDDSKGFRRALRRCGRCEKYFLAIGVGQGQKEFHDECLLANERERSKANRAGRPELFRGVAKTNRRSARHK